MKRHSSIGRILIGGLVTAGLALASVPLSPVTAEADYALWRNSLGTEAAAPAGHASFETLTGGAETPATSDPEFKYVPVRRY